MERAARPVGSRVATLAVGTAETVEMTVATVVIVAVVAARLVGTEEATDNKCRQTATPH